MPLYEYRCPNGHDFEKFFRSIGGAQAAEECPECGAIAARLMSAAGLVFKGSGFYITDYGKDGKKVEREAATATAKASAKAETAAADKKTGEVSAAKSPESATTPSPAKPAAESKPATPAAKQPTAPKKSE